MASVLNSRGVGGEDLAETSTVKGSCTAGADVAVVSSVFKGAMEGGLWVHASAQAYEDGPQVLSPSLWPEITASWSLRER